jgi:hypothetical protein
MRHLKQENKTWQPDNNEREKKYISGQSYRLQIQRSGFGSQCYQIFWEVIGLERAPLSLVIATEELIERKSAGCGLENRDYGHRGPAALTTRHASIHKSWH